MARPHKYMLEIEIRAGRSVRNLWRARAFLNAWRMGGVLFWRTANRINGDMPAAREAHH